MIKDFIHCIGDDNIYMIRFNVVENWYIWYINFNSYNYWFCTIFKFNFHRRRC